MILTHESEAQKHARTNWLRLHKECPIPLSELPLNMGLYLIPQTLSRILFLDFLYKKILETQGIIFDFGCRWGQNTSIFTTLREIYEPYNRLRRIVGFDTFTGIAGCTDKDTSVFKDGSYSSTIDYEKYLSELIGCIEAEGAMARIRRTSIIKGDVRDTVPKYLESHREAIVSLAFFDMDIYEPTLDALNAIRPKLTKGSILAFDEVNDEPAPGETQALEEAIGLGTYAIKRYQFNSRCSYLIIE